MPSVQPGEAKPVGAGVIEKLAWTAKRAASLLTRLGEMCSGETVTYCLQQGFVDDDHRHRSTMPNSKPLVKLDHMLVRAAVVATLPRKHDDGLSDHRILEGYIAAMEPDLTQAA